MKENILEKLAQNELVAEEDKDAVRKFLDVARSISFGKIAPRLEGYIMAGHGYPRCTSVLQMDGAKAGALMEWAKRQVAGRIEKTLLERIKSGGALAQAEIEQICLEGLEDPDKQKNDAADVGTGVHDNNENWLTGYAYEDTQALRQFSAIWQSLGYTLIGTEIPIVWRGNDGSGFGGRLDILAYRDRKFYILDEKTSRSIHDSYGCQVSAYKAAVEQMSNGAIKIAGCKIIHLPNLETLNERQKKEYDKRGSVVELKDLNDAFEHYRLLLGLYNKRNNKYF